MDVPLRRAKVLGRTILTNLGAVGSDANKAVQILIDNELEGYTSHGLLRLVDYARQIRAGTMRPQARPTVRQCSPSSWLVDGQRGFGHLAALTVVDTLVAALERLPVAVVGLTNSSHLGRLASVALPVARAGYVVLGCVNCLGAGPHVAPPGGSEGRLCTNPIVVGIPSDAPGPLVLDISTSTVAEGKLREAFLRGSSIPAGWLVDAEGRPELNPATFYDSGQSRFLTSLGAPLAGHKGFGLALAVEVLAGVLTGAGFARPDPPPSGNAGFFLGLVPELFGLSRDAVLESLKELIAHLQETPRAAGVDEIRIPGLRHRSDTRNRTENRPIHVPDRLWAELTDLARRT